MNKFNSVLGACCFWLFLATATCFAQRYTITNLGVRPGGDASYGNALNNRGQVVGHSYVTSGATSAAHAFLWDGAFHDLGTLGGTSSGAFGINDSGVITGDSTLAGDYPRHAFVYDGTMHDLGNSLGGDSSQAQGINNAGKIVGCAAVLLSTGCHAFMFDGITMHDLGVLDGGLESNAAAINDAGQIVGYSFTSGFAFAHAFLYDGTMQDLGTLGGRTSEATAINDVGQIVGQSALPGDSVQHAYLFDGTMHDLGTLGGDSRATGINNDGQVVGYSVKNGQPHAFIYYHKKMLDLNDLIPADSGWTLMLATAINDFGQITGTGFYGPNQDLRAFLLTPKKCRRGRCP